MLAHLELEWFFFKAFGLPPDKAAHLAWSLPIVFLVFAALLAVVWLRRVDHWTGTLAGCAAALALLLTIDAEMFAPMIAWWLQGVRRPDFLSFVQAFPKECIAAAIGFPLLHGFALLTFRDEISTWTARFRL